MQKYRSCVVGVFINADGFVLVAKRKDTACWQFPQGGVEAEESEENALYREMLEEIGCNQFSIIQKLEHHLFYDFPIGLDRPIAKEFKGQEQRWFLCKFHDSYGPKIENAIDDEFEETKWILPEEAFNYVVEWKKQVYFNALNEFKLLREI